MSRRFGLKLSTSNSQYWLAGREKVVEKSSASQDTQLSIWRLPTCRAGRAWREITLLSTIIIVAQRFFKLESKESKCLRVPWSRKG